MAEPNEIVPPTGGGSVEGGGSPMALAIGRQADCLALRVPPPVEPYAGYDPEVEEKEYCRALMDPKDLADLKEKIEEYGFLTAKEIRKLLDQNTNTKFTPDGVFVLDADMIVQIDQRTRDCVFILPSNEVYTREELMGTYPFELFQTTPEEIFVQQEIGVFSARASALTQTAKEYLARDLGSDEEFIMLEDMVGRLTRTNYTDRRPPEKIVKTKVFLGREGWEDFVAMTNHTRAVRRLVGNAMRKSQQTGQLGFLGAMFGGGVRSGGLLSLEDEEGIQTRLRQQEEALARREAEVARREAEVAKQAEGIAALIGNL